MTSPDMHANDACRAAEPALGALLSGDFTRDEFLLANRHLAECSACRDTFGSIHSFPAEFREAYGIERKSKRPSRRQEFIAVAAIAAALLMAFSLTLTGRAPVSVTLEPSVPMTAKIETRPDTTGNTLAQVVPSSADPARSLSVETAAVTRRTSHAANRSSSHAPSATTESFTPIEVQETDLVEMLNTLTDEELLNLIS